MHKQMQCVSKSARRFSDHKTLWVRPIGTFKLFKSFYHSFSQEKQHLLLKLFVLCLGYHLYAVFSPQKYRISTLVSNINVSVGRKSPRFSLCPAFPVSFYHPAVWPILHPPNHPLPPPPWTRSPEGICAVCLCWRLGANRWTGETCYQTVKVWKLLRKLGIFQILIKVHNPPIANRLECF